MTKLKIGAICGTALLLATAVVVALRERQQVPLPEVPVAQTPAAVRVKAVERKAELVERGEVAAASGAVAIVCGEDAATADRYEARNDALRLIARRRDLPKGDVDALLAYLRRADDALRVERVAALKNDVMNLLRNQESPVEGLAETLVGMVEENIGPGRAGVPPPAADGEGTPSLPGNTIHPPVVIDYCLKRSSRVTCDLAMDAWLLRTRPYVVTNVRCRVSFVFVSRRCPVL